MSSFVFEEIECSHCHRMLKFTMFKSINVTLDPDYKEKVLDLSLFRERCPDCGNVTVVQYGFLYHDMDLHYMIDVIWDPDHLFGTSDPMLKNWIGNLNSEPPYRFRNVFGYRELLEKIHIFDSGLNDYAVEVLKAVIRKDYDIPLDQILAFQRIQGDEIVFSTADRNGTVREISSNLYSQALEAITPKLPPEDEHRYVDECLFRGNAD